MGETIDILIKAKDETKAAVDSAKVELSGLEKAVGGLDAAGAELRNWGAGLTAAVTLPLAGIAAGAMAVWSEFDAGSDTLVSVAGVSGEALAALEGNVKNLFTTTAGLELGMGDLGAVVGQLNVGLGVSGPLMDEIGKSVADMSRLTGTDAVANTELLTQAVNAWGVENQNVTGFLNDLYATTQLTGVGTSDLLASLASGAPVLEQYGFSWANSAAMMGVAHQAGLDWGTVQAALKTGMGELTADGKTVEEGFYALANRMGNAKDETEKLQIAQEIFGARGGAVMVKFIGEVWGMADGVQDAMGEMDTSLVDATEGVLDWNDHLALAFNEIKVAAIPLGQALADTLQSLLPHFRNLVDWVVKVADWFGNLSPQMQRTIVIIGGVIAAIGPLLAILGTVASAVAAIIPLVTGMGAVLAVILSPIGAVIAIIAAVVVGLGLLYKAWTEDWGGIKTKTKEFVGWIGDSIKGLWDNITKWFKDGFKAVGTWLGDLIKKIADWFKPSTWIEMGKNIIDGIIEGIKKAASGIFDGLKKAVTGAMDGVKNLLGIHSPSAVAAKEIGLPFAQGIGMGIRSGMPAAMRNVTNNNYWSIELVGGASAGQDVYNSVQMLSALYG